MDVSRSAMSQLDCVLNTATLSLHRVSTAKFNVHARAICPKALFEDSRGQWLTSTKCL